MVIKKTFQEKADEIIMQVAYTDEDIKELCKIKRQLAVEYDKACKVLGNSSEAYERERMGKYIQARKEGKKDGESKEIARALATKKYGSKFMYEEFIKGKKVLIDNIRDFIINYYTTQKEKESASMTVQD